MHGLILQHDTPEDYVIATGVQHSVREFCNLAFRDVGIELEFTGSGMDEKGIDKATGRTLIEVSQFLSSDGCGKSLGRPDENEDRARLESDEDFL